MSAETVRFDVTVKHETNKAYLVIYEDEEFWIPKSQIKDEDYETVDGETHLCTIWIPAWLAAEKEMV